MPGVFQEVMCDLDSSSYIYNLQSQRHYQTLKIMMCTYYVEYPEDWDKNISFLLFAVCDVVNESPGFSLFELVYGHEVGTLLKLSKERRLAQDQEVNLLDCVSEFKVRLNLAGAVTRRHLDVVQEKMKACYDREGILISLQLGIRLCCFYPFWEIL